MKTAIGIAIMIIAISLVVTLALIEFKCPEGYGPQPGNTLFDPETGEAYHRRMLEADSVRTDTTDSGTFDWDYESCLDTLEQVLKEVTQ